MSVTQRSELSEGAVRERRPSPDVRFNGSRLPKLSILMCAFNEEKTIVSAVSGVLRLDYPCEIELVVVDDGSSDATSDLLDAIDDPRLVRARHAVNQGKGAALRTAATLATGTYVMPFDADLEYSPTDIPRVIDPVLSGRFEVVYGARLFGYNTVYQSYRYAIGNRFLTTFANILYDSYVSDLHTCLKLMPLATFRQLALRENGFGLDTEITASLLRLGIRPFEVPISYYSRSHAQGKKINWRDAVACVLILMRVRMTRRSRITVPSATVVDSVPADREIADRAPADRAPEQAFSEQAIAGQLPAQRAVPAHAVAAE